MQVVVLGFRVLQAMEAPLNNLLLLLVGLVTLVLTVHRVDYLILEVAAAEVQVPHHPMVETVEMVFNQI